MRAPIKAERVRPNPNHALLLLSADFEGALAYRSGEENPALAALQTLRGLEDVVRASLAYKTGLGSTETKLPSGLQTGASQPAGRTPAPIPTQWSSRQKAYRPALGDPSLVEALLKFRNPPAFENSLPPSGPLAPGTPRKTPRAPETPLPPPPEQFHSAQLNRFSARDLEPCFPLAPSSNLMRPKP